MFFGKVGFKERCRQTYISSISEEVKPLSPLNDEQMAEIQREANAVANRIAAAGSNRKGKASSKTMGKPINQQLFKTEALMSLLTSASDTNANKENVNLLGGKMTVEKTKDVNISDNNRLAVPSTDALSVTSPHLTSKLKDNLTLEISNESDIISVSSCFKEHKKLKENLLIDIDSDSEIVSTNSHHEENVLSLTEVTSSITKDTRCSFDVPKPKKKGKRKQKENLLIDISNDFEDGSASECDASIEDLPEENKKDAMEIEVTTVDKEKDDIENAEKPTEKETNSSPQTRHTRNGTYTLGTVPLDQVPAKKSSLPVVGGNNVSVSAGKEPKLSRGEATRRSFTSRLKPPSKLAVPIQTSPKSVSQSIVI